MNNNTLSIGNLIQKTIVVHTVTYFVFGVTAYLLFDYQEKFSTPPYSYILRSLDHPLVMAGPLFQPIRGLLFALALYPLRSVIFFQERGWLVLWGLFLVFGIFSPFGPVPCSIEGMIYMPFPFLDHITGLPEIFFQSMALAWLLCRWVNHPEKKGLSIALYAVFIITLLLPTMGLVLGPAKEY